MIDGRYTVLNQTCHDMEMTLNKNKNTHRENAIESYLFYLLSENKTIVRYAKQFQM